MGNESIIKPERDSKGRLLPGHSLGGRKKIPAEVREILEVGTVNAAKFLVDVINNTSEKTENRIRASEIVMDRIYGKPKQQVDALIDTQVSTQVDFSSLTVEQLLKLANIDKEENVIDVTYSET